MMKIYRGYILLSSFMQLFLYNLKMAEVYENMKDVSVSAVL